MSYDNAPRNDRDRTVHEADTVAAAPVSPADLPHGDALDQEKRRFGGMKFGSAFFGWLAAFGAVVLLSAVVGAVGAAIGMETGTTVEDVASAASDDPQTVGIVGAIALAVALFVAYLAGGYVAGRMARFSGALQGFAVWLWSIIIAIVVALLSMLAGSRWDVLATLDGFPRIPMDATVTGIITAIVAALITLGGAILGGILGMRYHRRVDRLGVDRDADGM
ncbi:hypothetical protein [Microbacterium flavescens]|jgi:hypothetical protein|uniref:hypothetical protein n=1 Tax=Microbacterium flavescens TaxID=69366 RepID=UPI001BDE2B4C|nr:hypothetical protein [Microbacterium flavescens]